MRQSRYLQLEYVKMPASEEEWLAVSKDFEQIWNFSNCVGAIDGKHVVMQVPRNASSSFFKYKGIYSLVLLAMCDAHYNFLMVDMGMQVVIAMVEFFLIHNLEKLLEGNSLSLRSLKVDLFL